ncbi:type II secretion system protein N [Achromobacter sp. GG226]|uniref:type II secretion system protein N n=1 Tax=Verticiella alkaliphila TaxID=2779529 RepID=UPI001C0CC82E|nr:type II secretion system protein N [Verticiella sp. GG226]MBU4613078.1 type II secretion system protein N [Verticiella sp. GG226]
MRARLVRRMALGLGLGLIVLVTALAVLPARWLMRALPQHWPVAIVDAAGTVWNGTALVALGPPGARTTLPQPVRWRAGWADGVRLQLEHPWLDCTLGLRPGFTSLGISPCGLRLPAQVLAAVGAPLNTLKPAGQLALRWPGLRLPYGGAAPAGELLTLDWRQAGSALSMVRPLGDYRAALTGRDGAAHLSLTTLNGPLQLRGDGTFTPQGGLRFSGVASPAPDASDATVAGLQAMLSAIGRRSGNDTLLQIGR